MKNKLCSIGMMSIVLFTVLMAGNKQQEAQNDAEMIEAVELINVAGLLGKEKGMEIATRINGIEIKNKKEEQEIAEHPYYVTCRYFDCASEQIPPPAERIGGKYDYVTPLVQLEIPLDKVRENRLNRMLMKEGQKRLPGGTREQWRENTMIHIDYRSDRYLCWRYIPMPSLPKDCEREDLYFILDMKKEKFVEYPKGSSRLFWSEGNLYKEMEENWEKTVEQQDETQKETGYALREIQAEYDGIFFSAVEVSELADKVIEKRINEHLQEGLKACIENEGWNGNKDEKQELFDKTRIYVSYKSDRWLSVVYSIQMAERWRWEEDEICDLPVVVDIKTGERVMLDDLMEMDGLVNYIQINNSWRAASDQIGGFEGLLRSEKGNLQNMTEKGMEAMASYNNEWRTFYLYRGKLVLLMEASAYDFEVPLPEIHEYLKVDPWYD